MNAGVKNQHAIPTEPHLLTYDPTQNSTYLKLQVLVATIMELKARVSTTFSQLREIILAYSNELLNEYMLVLQSQQLQPFVRPDPWLNSSLMMGTPGKGAKSAIQKK